jgi:hypothetical protein
LAQFAINDQARRPFFGAEFQQGIFQGATVFQIVASSSGDRRPQA